MVMMVMMVITLAKQNLVKIFVYVIRSGFSSKVCDRDSITRVVKSGLKTGTGAQDCSKDFWWERSAPDYWTGDWSVANCKQAPTGRNQKARIPTNVNSQRHQGAGQQIPTGWKTSPIVFNHNNSQGTRKTQSLQKKTHNLNNHD